MSITITRPKDSPITSVAVIRTKNTAYALGILYGKYPVHLYYGGKTRGMDLSYKSNIRSFSPFYPEHGLDFLPDTALCEFPGYGYGDFRAAAIRVKDLSTGSEATEFLFKKFKKHKGRLPLPAPIFGDLPCAEADKIARDIIDNAGYKGLFGHSLGHGVGLYIHESPRLAASVPADVLLKPGHVVTVEPGIYVEGKYGCRIEDMVAILPDGTVHDFTKSPKELIELC